MIALPNPNSKMTLSSDQLRKLIEVYATDVVDGMDVRDLCSFAIDTICDNLDGMNESELMKEMQFFYQEDQLKEIVESVTAE